MIKLVLLRHGESVWNRENRFTGWTDVGLTPQGEQEAREAGEFAQGHILSARNIPLDQLEARLKEIERYKEKPVIVSCAVGNRAGSAASLLRKQGFTNVVNLSGGIAAWRQAGLPTEK